MIDPAVIGAVFGPVATVAVAVFGYYTAREKRAREESEREAAEREEQRRKVDECIMGMTAANADALMVVLRHLHGEQLNGDVERAMANITRETSEYSQVRDHIAANL